MKDIYVQIGKVKVTSNDNNLHALLGSCVGVALLCPAKNLYGLAHCLLPSSPIDASKNDTRYVDIAIDTLLRLMKINEAERKTINAVIAGGGNMTKPVETDATHLIGQLNTKSAIEYLLKLKIDIIHKDIGGAHGRKFSLYCASNDYKIKKIPRNLISGDDNG